MSKLVVVRIEPFEGQGSYLNITDSQGYQLKHMFLIGVLNNASIVEVDDYGYLTLPDALAAANLKEPKEVVLTQPMFDDAYKQITELVNNMESGLVFSLLSDEQIEQLAADWNQGRDK